MGPSAELCYPVGSARRREEQNIIIRFRWGFVRDIRGKEKRQVGHNIWNGFILTVPELESELEKRRKEGRTQAV